MEALLHKLYYSSDARFGGKESLYQKAKQQEPSISKYDVKSWLKKQDAYTLHKPVRRLFEHRRTIVSGPVYQFQADLCDMQAFAKENDGFKYLLTCIDIFSKYAWAVPVKSKQASHVAAAFLNGVLKDEQSEGRNRCQVLQTDAGGEFLGKAFQDMLKRENVKHFVSLNPDVKCSIVERFNRTLKSKMWRLFTHQGSYRYIDELANLLSSYNNSFHRSIQRTPMQVTKENTELVRQALYGKIQKQYRFKFNLGDQVRLAKKKGPFTKGYVPQWTTEVFTISKRIPRHPPCYMVKDYLGREIKGIFYDHELQSVTKTSFAIEKVIKVKTVDKRKLALVKWQGYGDEYNQWIPYKDIAHYGGN